jgi:hypothetical protein
MPTANITTCGTQYEFGIGLAAAAGLHAEMVYTHQGDEDGEITEQRVDH